MGTATTSNYRVIALIIASAFFMENLDSTIIATALPAMAESLGAEPLRMNFAMSAYLLSLTLFIPLSGQIADRFGARNIFRVAILLFIVSSVLCGMSPNLPWLIGARLLQGLSGAMMVPVGRLILLRSIEKSQIVVAMSWVLVPAMVGPAVGPLIGGLLTTYLSWHWIFYINVPIGLFGIYMVSRYIPDVRRDQSQPMQPFDYRGFVLAGVALCSLLLGMESIGHANLPPAVVPGLLALAVMAAALYSRHYRRHPAPVLDLGLMRLPTLKVSLTSGLLYRIAYGGFPFLLPLMLQVGFGWSAAQSGVVTFAAALGGLAMKFLSSAALRKFGYRNTLIWNGAISAASFAICAAFRPEWPLYLMYLVLIVGGLSRSLQFNCYGTLTYADVPASKMSSATTLASTVQQMTGALGIALGALVLDISKRVSGHATVQVSDFSIGFIVIGVLCALAIPYCRTLDKDAGAELSGHR